MEKGLKYAIFKTKWGFFGFLADARGILRTTLPTNSYRTTKKYLLVGMFQSVREDGKLYPGLQKAIRNYYKGTYANFKKLPLAINHNRLTGFALKVFRSCTQVPLGETVTYAQLAKEAGSPRAARAVGNVLAKNQLPLLVPCHRVIRADGKIGNFSAPGGSRTKKKMLEYEKKLRCRV